MILAWLFWLFLAAPGVCIVLRFRSPAEQTSIFETIAVGYLLSFALLTPLIVLGYLLELPTWTLSAGIVAVTGAALAWLARAAGTRLERVALSFQHVASVAALAFILLQAAAVGGHITNDADFHLARIRFLYDHGLSNADPITGTGFSHPYHTNVLHALVAAGSQLTGLDPIVMWQASLPWAKLVSAAGAATLCLRLGGSGLATWLVALFQLGGLLRVDWAIYPNQLAPFWLLPVGLGGCIALFTSENRRYHATVLASSALLLGLVHGLYAAYLGALGASVLGALMLQRMLTRREQRRSALLLALLGALLLSIPAPAVLAARYAHAPQQKNFDYQGGSPTPRPSKPDRWTRSLRADEAGRFSLPVTQMLGGSTECLLAVAALAALIARRRVWAVLAIGAPLTCCLLVLHEPSIAHRVVSTLGGAWILERLMDVVSVLHVALLGAGLVPSWPANRGAGYAAALAPPAAALCGTLIASGGASEGALQKVRDALDDIRQMQVLSGDLPSSVAEDQALLRTVPPGSTLLTHPLAARQLRKLHDVFFIRASRNHTGVDDMLDRTVAMHTLQYAKRSNDEVRTLLDKYRIRYAVQKYNHPIRWLSRLPHVGSTSSIALIDLTAIPSAQKGELSDTKGP